MSSDTLNPEIRHVVEDELYSGETLLWAGQPKPRSKLRRTISSASGITTLTVMAGVIALLLVAGLVILAAADSDPTFPGDAPPFVVVIPFLAIIIPMIAIFAPMARMFGGGGDIYALTDRRALIISQRGGGARTIKSFGAADIQRIERRMYRDGTGDVIFARETRGTTARSALYGGTSDTTDIGFLGVHSAREVELMMLETFKMVDGGAYKYKSDEFGDDGELVIEDDLSALTGGDDHSRSARR